jgi:hypothetical protein
MTHRFGALFGRYTRNHLPIVAAVNSKILVGCQNDGIGKRFGHANKASIGEAHGNVGYFSISFVTGSMLWESPKATTTARRRTN